MNHARQLTHRVLVLIAAVVAVIVASTQMRADTGTCNGVSITLPFTDVASNNGFFCSIASAYFSGLANGTSATTYSPSANVTRDQMAAFVSRTLDQSLKRGSNRAVQNQWWTPAAITSEAKTQVGDSPTSVRSDGADLWVANSFNGTVSRVQASDGRLVGSWGGATAANAVLVARGHIFVTGGTSPGRLYSIDPTQSSGAVTVAPQDLGDNPLGIAYDGSRIWTANFSGSVSIFSFVCIPGFCVSTVTAGFNAPSGILYDGSHIWVSDSGDNSIKKLDAGGSIVQTIPVGIGPKHLTFDGTNIWVPNISADSVTVVRVKDSLGNPLAQPFVLMTLTGNGLNEPFTAAFDGQRILVTNFNGNSVSLWKATDLTRLGFFATGFNSNPVGACSDGLNFWIVLNGTDQLGRF